MVRQTKLRHVTTTFYLVLIIFTFMVFKEQAAFSVSNKENVVVLAANYDDIRQEMLATSGEEKEDISGEEIYKVKCMACHRFETRKVGPAHKDVLPKYIGKKAELIKFILNPVKVNPEFPAMAKQGLKPKEAKAVAEYMLEEYGPKLKQNK